MITIKRLSDSTLNDAVIAWNKGFEGYYFNMTTNVEQFTKRLVLDGLSPDISIVAFEEDVPVGFILSGVRLINGKKVAWNGGTGVSPDYRGKGVSKQLMEAALTLYKEEGVQIATLEAISENEKAIKLYVNYGYKVNDHLVHLQSTGTLPDEAFAKSGNYTLETKLPIDVINIPFYKKMSSWQTHWNNGRDTESIIVSDEGGEIVGYSIFKRAFNEDAKQVAIVLIQCEVAPTREDGKAIVDSMLHDVLSPGLDIQRTAINIPVSNKTVYDSLKKAGFSIKAEQVYMLKEM